MKPPHPHVHHVHHAGRHPATHVLGSYTPAISVNGVRGMFRVTVLRDHSLCIGPMTGAVWVHVPATCLDAHLGHLRVGHHDANVRHALAHAIGEEAHKQDRAITSKSCLILADLLARTVAHAHDTYPPR